MLPHRSIIYQCLIVLSVSLADCAKRSEDVKAARPDYAEFYKSRAAAALKSVPGSETAASEFYEHIKSDPLGVEKYIDKDDTAADEKPYESKPGPNYITYKVPVKELAKYKRENEYEAAIEALDKEYSVPTIYKLKDNIETEESEAESNSRENIKPESTNSAPFSSHSPGFDSQFYTRHTATPTESLSSNEQYSYQPTDNKYVKIGSYKNSQGHFNPSYGQAYKASRSNYEYQPSENVQSDIKSSNCKKTVKQGAAKDLPMTCLVCKDPKSGAKSEQCSYTSASSPEAYYSAKNEKYSQPHKSENYRFRRYAPQKEKEEYVDPYEYVKAESQKHFSQPKEFESEYYKPKDYYEEYQFPEDYFAGESKIKSESEIQSEKLMKEGGSCKEVNKNGMKCKVCKNEKTGGNYEQCSYSSTPSEKKYAYVSERKFDGDGNPIEDKAEESSEPKETVTEIEEKRPSESKSSQTKSRNQKSTEDEGRINKRSKLIQDDPYDIPKHFVEDTLKNQKVRSRGLNPELYGSADSSYESKKETHVPDEYQQKVFSKFGSRPEPQRSNDARKKNQEYQAEENKKDVEKVLEEFTKKDRSSCKKAHKNGMTCYLCVNKDGTQHEECMFVAANNPQVSHVAYHEVEEFKNRDKPEAAASNIKETEADAPLKRKRFFKKVTTIPSGIQTSPSETRPQTVKYVPPVSSVSGKFRAPRKLRRSKNFSGTDPVFAESKIQETRVKPIFAESKTQETRVRPEYKEPSLPTPQEFVVGEAEGAFSSETKPVYSKAFGVTLPRYMLDKSEFEKNFDSFASQE